MKHDTVIFSKVLGCREIFLKIKYVKIFSHQNVILFPMMGKLPQWSFAPCWFFNFDPHFPSYGNIGWVFTTKGDRALEERAVGRKECEERAKLRGKVRGFFSVVISLRPTA